MLTKRKGRRRKRKRKKGRRREETQAHGWRKRETDRERKRGNERKRGSLREKGRMREREMSKRDETTSELLSLLPEHFAVACLHARELRALKMCICLEAGACMLAASIHR
jgi:hypothetical protein